MEVTSLQNWLPVLQPRASLYETYHHAIAQKIFNVPPDVPFHLLLSKLVPEALYLVKNHVFGSVTMHFFATLLRILLPPMYSEISPP